MEKWRVFATFERNDCPSKLVTKLWNDVVSREFHEYMSKGYVNSVIKRPSNNMEGSVLPLSKESIALLKVKHFLGKAASEDTKLHGLLPTVENIIFDVICNSMILEAAKITQGGSGPSGMDADGWRQILVSKDYGNTVNDLHKAVTSLIKKYAWKK